MKQGYDPKILLDPLVFPFREPVSLRMESGRKVLLDIKFLCEGGSEVRSETRILVRDNLLW